MNGYPTNGLENSACSTMYVTPESSLEPGDPPFAETTCTLSKRDHPSRPLHIFILCKKPPPWRHQLPPFFPHGDLSLPFLRL
ncbi:hypothetical protein GJ744_001913 [Endocarpon pusillum]|uniref:Uncharacterized protein n=1 Tax=Endocarpon pusillum TaxID=364733 RepID=A0A8H7AWD1_9EURO|nr:hypothetical protein GJ744_001913 [Endocarpon pusillum]